MNAGLSLSLFMLLFFSVRELLTSGLVPVLCRLR